MTSEQLRVFAYRPGAVLRVRGEDAFSFLQGQFTNDLKNPVGSVAHGLWLNQKGKILADSEVLRVAANEFLLTSATSTAALIRQRLEDYLVADEVTLTDETAEVHGLLVGGSGSGEAIQELAGPPPLPGRFLRAGEITIHGGRRVPGVSFELLGPEKALAAVRQQLLAGGATDVGAGELEFARISAGIPLVPVDLGAGDLPNEGGLEDTAISYTKGCYLGQEVMARLKNLGRVRRRLHVVRGHGRAPVPGVILYQGEKKAGEIRSVASQGDIFVALAMLSLVNLDPAAGLSLEPSGRAAVTIVPHG